MDNKGNIQRSKSSVLSNTKVKGEITNASATNKKEMV